MKQEHETWYQNNQFGISELKIIFLSYIYIAMYLSANTSKYYHEYLGCIHSNFLTPPPLHKFPLKYHSLEKEWIAAGKAIPATRSCYAIPG